MKYLKNRSFLGRCFALLFILNISLVVIAVVKNDDLYVAYAILLSCFQFYLYEKLKISRIFFKCDIPLEPEPVKVGAEDEKDIEYYRVNYN